MKDYLCAVIKMDRPTILRLLVAISMASLFGFLVFWNRDNYYREREELKKDLQNQMSLACSQYRDSVVQTIFQVIELDTTLEVRGKLPTRIMKRQFTNSDKTIVINTHDVSTSHGKDFHTIRGRDTALAVIIDTTFTTHEQNEVIAWRHNDSSTLRIEFSKDTVKEDIVFRSKNNDFTHFQTEYIELEKIPGVYKTIDSIFIKRLKLASLPLQHQLAMAPQETIHSGKEIIIPFEHESFALSQIPITIFSDVDGFIWKRMMTPLLMSLVLFGVVALSFYFILKSWMSQVRLIRIKNEFISNMTHELKTPISTVGVALEALHNYGGLDDPVKRKEYLDISKYELNRLKLLVDKVLNMSAIDHGAIALSTSELDIKVLIDEMLHSMKLHFDKNGVDVKYKFEGNNFNLIGDKVHLTNVFYNLIDNAVKYGGDQPRIEVQLIDRKDAVVTKIKDSGPGIPGEYLDKIYDRFFRVPTNNIHNVKGHGLGLHYVKTIIEAHNGKVKAKSASGLGTTFIVTLPRKR